MVYMSNTFLVGVHLKTSYVIKKFHRNWILCCFFLFGHGSVSTIKYNMTCIVVYQIYPLFLDGLAWENSADLDPLPTPTPHLKEDSNFNLDMSGCVI